MKRRMDTQELNVRNFAIRVSWLGIMITLFLHAIYMGQVYGERTFSEIALLIQMMIYLVTNIVQSLRISDRNEAIKRNLLISIIGLVLTILAFLFLIF